MAENDANEGEEKKSSKLVLIIVIVVLLAGGGGAAYYFLAGGSETAESEQAEAESETEEAEEESKEEESEEVVIGDDAYYNLGMPLTVTFPPGDIATLVQISVALLADDEETVEEIQKHEPVIRNNFLMAISASTPKILMTKEGKTALRDEMVTEVSKIMKKMTGKSRVSNVFFTTFVMQ